MSKENFVIKKGKPGKFNRLPHQSSQDETVRGLVQLAEGGLPEQPLIEDRKIEK